MASKLYLPGSYHQHALTIRFDTTRDTTTLSTDFVRKHGIPFRVIPAGLVVRGVASGPLVVPTATGRYICSFPMDIGYSGQEDVVLGRDWTAHDQTSYKKSR